jgi:hypothetical protein
VFFRLKADGDRDAAGDSIVRVGLEACICEGDLPETVHLPEVLTAQFKCRRGAVHGQATVRRIEVWSVCT